jgi:hypothetical protein
MSAALSGVSEVAVSNEQAIAQASDKDLMGLPPEQPVLVRLFFFGLAARLLRMRIATFEEA